MAVCSSPWLLFLFGGALLRVGEDVADKLDSDSRLRAHPWPRGHRVQAVMYEPDAFRHLGRASDSRLVDEFVDTAARVLEELLGNLGG
jgi:hypothetical protein